MSGKTAVVTGGAGGIGLAISEELLKSNLVQRLAIVDNQANQEATAILLKKFPKAEIIYVKTDITNKTELDKSFKHVISKFGSIDIVVNSAGVLKDGDIETTLNVNLKGVMLSSMAGLSHMTKENETGNGGCIVNIASVTGLNPTHILPIYSASKFAVVGFTRAMGHEYFFNKTGVKFVTICPGLTRTTLVANFDDNLLFPHLLDELTNVLDDVMYQPANEVGKCVVESINSGSNGSVWLVENFKIKELHMQDYAEIDFHKNML